MITILPISSKDHDRLKSRIIGLKAQGLTHSLKKAPGAGKKRKKIATTNGLATEAILEDEARPSNTEQFNNTPPNRSSAIRNTGTASLTAKVLAEQQDRNKRRKTAENENLKGLFSSSNGDTKLHADFMTRGFSIPVGAKR